MQPDTLTPDQSRKIGSEPTGTGSKSFDLLFPEKKYQPPQVTVRKVHEARIRVGYENMKRGSAVICALARDVEQVIERTICQVTMLLDCFKESAAVIVENDSKDNTPRFLKIWAEEDKRVTAISHQFNDPVHPPERSFPRADRMAHYRNMAKDCAQRKFGRFDHVIVVDTDMPVGFSLDGVANSFSWTGWDVLGSNGILRQTMGVVENYPRQYDAWAFRREGDWAPLPGSEVNQMRFALGSDLIPVYSCFGGLAVYRMAAYKAGAYNGSDCEHVALHRTLRYNGFGRLFLNPSMICDHGTK